MFRRCLIAGMFAVALLATTRTASGTWSRFARARAASPAVQAVAQRNAAIRQMPLLQRPDRPGHFVGNTIRRVYRRNQGYAW